MPAPVVEAPTVVEASPPVVAFPPPVPPSLALVVVPPPPLPPSLTLLVEAVLVEPLSPPVPALLVVFELAEPPLVPLPLEVTLLEGVDEPSSLVLPPPVPLSRPSLEGGSSRIGVAQLHAPKAPSASQAAGLWYQRFDIGTWSVPHPRGE
jgi:hypothetical protein